MLADAATPSVVTMSAGGFTPNFGSSGSYSGSQQQQTGHPTIQLVPTDNGSVTSSQGVMRGWGKVDCTGTLNVSGQVIADGHGLDRTLNLLSFNAVRNDADNAPNGGRAGWYAQNHGRLTLPLEPSFRRRDFTWGEDPTDPVLDLVNSVRIQPAAALAATPGDLALLAPDRSDAPPLTGMNGVPLALWQVDPSVGDIEAADVTVRYNDTLVDKLGASESSVQLWAYSYGDWQQVQPGTLSLDTTDHLVSGLATDFSYIAVSVPPADGVDAEQVLAEPLAAIAPTVPEPTSLGVIVLGAGLLLRRGRRSARFDGSRL
jgi:hypothetical protein